MANQKIERVNADDITLHYAGNWYCILFASLVNVQAARERYGLHPEVSLFIPLGMLTPYCPALDRRHPITGEMMYSEQVVYPDPPPFTEEVELDMRIRMMKNRIMDMHSEIFDDLRKQFDLFPADYAALLTESLMP